MACPFLFIILQEKGKIKLHLGYKSGISFSKVASRIQKLHFVYKYSVVTLQSGVSAYKVASRFSIKLPLKNNCTKFGLGGADKKDSRGNM